MNRYHSNFSANIVIIFYIFIWIYNYPAHAQQTNAPQESIPDSYLLLLEESKSLRQRGEFESSIKQFKKILQSYPNYYEAQLNLTLAYFHSRKYEKTLKSIDRLLEIMSDEKIEDYRLFNTIGWMNFEMGRFKEAERFFDIALENQDKLSDKLKKVLYNNVGLLHLYTNNLSIARHYLTIASEDYGNIGASKNLEIVLASLREENLDSEFERLKSHVEWSITDQKAQILNDGQIVSIDLLRKILLETQVEGLVGYKAINDASDQDLLRSVQQVLAKRSMADSDSAN